MKNKIKVLSLFDGIGGARQALKELNIDCEYYASEIDKWAIQVAKANHPDIVQLGDVKKLNINVLHLSGAYDKFEVLLNQTHQSYDNLQDIISKQEMLYWLNEGFTISAKIGTQIKSENSPTSASIQGNNEIWFSKSGLGDIGKLPRYEGSGDDREEIYSGTWQELLQCGKWRYVYRANNGDQEKNIKRANREESKPKDKREVKASNYKSVQDIRIKKEAFRYNKKSDVETKKQKEIFRRTKDPKKWSGKKEKNRREEATNYVCEISNAIQSKYDTITVERMQRYFLSVYKKMEVTLVKSADSIDIFKGKFQLICGGFPCQSFSIAGNRKGLQDERGQLFFEALRILNEVKPKYFLFENVASMSKANQDFISEKLGIKPTLINSSLLTAQQRKRLYWVGKLVNGKYEQVNIEQPEDKKIYLKDIIESGVVDRDKSYCIDANYFKGGNLKSYFEKSRRQLVFDEPVRVAHLNKGGQGDRIYATNAKSVTLSALSGGLGAKTGLYAVAQRGRNIINGKRKDIKGAKTKQRFETCYSEKSNCLTSVQKDSLLLDLGNATIRKLTPTECERLQGFPDSYTSCVSNTQRYKALGNSFTVPVIKHILKNIDF